MELNIFSLNCSFVPSIKNNIDTRIENIVKHIIKNNHNVIVLQESFFYKFYETQYPEDILLNKLNELTEDKWYMSSQKKSSLFERTKLLNCGLVVISKFKITKSKFHMLPIPLSWNLLFFIRPWYFQECELTINDTKKITLFNIHITPSIITIKRLLGKPIANFSTGQIKYIYNYILKNVKNPWLIAGDWNLTPDVIIENNFFDKCILSYPPKPTVHGKLKFKVTESPPILTIDYAVIHNLEFKNGVQIIYDDTLSDHYPVKYDIYI